MDKEREEFEAALDKFYDEIELGDYGEIISNIEPPMFKLWQAAKAAPAWVSCAERLPTEEDADFRGQVWFCSSVTMPCLVLQEGFGAGQVAPNVYWMPTGLVRPEPPKEEA